MATVPADYRWQDHVPRLGAADLAVTVVVAGVLVAAVAGWPARLIGGPATAHAVAACGVLAEGQDWKHAAAAKGDV